MRSSLFAFGSLILVKLMPVALLAAETDTTIESTSAATTGLSAGCLQAPGRTRACPHKLYRAMQLPGMTAPALRCICVTDFAPLLTEPETPEQRLAQLRLKQQLSAHLQHDVEPVLQIIRR